MMRTKGQIAMESKAFQAGEFIGSVVIYGGIGTLLFLTCINVLKKRSNSEDSASTGVLSKQKGVVVKKRKLLFVLIGLVVITLIMGTFYWFQWRPLEVRKKCLSEVSSLTASISSNHSPQTWQEFKVDRDKQSSNLPPLNDKSRAILEGDKVVNDKDKNNYYRSCLAKNGLKPESLYVNLTE